MRFHQQSSKNSDHKLSNTGEDPWSSIMDLFRPKLSNLNSGVEQESPSILQENSSSEEESSSSSSSSSDESSSSSSSSSDESSSSSSSSCDESSSSKHKSCECKDEKNCKHDCLCQFLKKIHHENVTITTKTGQFIMGQLQGVKGCCVKIIESGSKSPFIPERITIIRCKDIESFSVDFYHEF
ncbi:hypothetical protein M3175_21895 [Robertmurraya korlensis]|uniref:hypothetical protein n=1 Tax=Robertmurraya korlensis TaxID=519977 RepID=UPI00203A7766|nr:hypothetical protein [Robertmurraya korlensis]MCM3603373.1 hypothetical protein [Robertmurraya korlensis]